MIAADSPIMAIDVVKLSPPCIQPALSAKAAQHSNEEQLQDKVEQQQLRTQTAVSAQANDVSNVRRPHDLQLDVQHQDWHAQFAISALEKQLQISAGQQPPLAGYFPALAGQQQTLSGQHQTPAVQPWQPVLVSTSGNLGLQHHSVGLHQQDPQQQPCGRPHLQLDDGSAKLRFVTGDNGNEVNGMQALSALAEGHMQWAVTGDALQLLLQLPDVSVLNAVMRNVVVFARMKPFQKGQVMNLLNARGLHQMHGGQ